MVSELIRLLGGTSAVVGMLTSGLSCLSGTGCAVHGGRVIEVGTVFKISDMPDKDAEGVEYRVGLDDESSLLNAIVGDMLEDDKEGED